MKLKNVLLLYFRIPHSYFRLLLYSMYEAETQASKKSFTINKLYKFRDVGFHLKRPFVDSPNIPGPA